MYTGFTYWNMTYREQTIKDENDDETVTYLVPEYFRYAVEYYSMDSYTEAQVYQQIMGVAISGPGYRGSNGSVSVVGNYRKLTMLLHRVLENDTDYIQELTTGVGPDGTGEDPIDESKVGGVRSDDPYIAEPPITGEE